MDAGPTWIGRTIGNRYQITSLLGRGGMSTVYQAIDTNLQRDVAIKIIHPHLTDNPEFLQRFEQEAAAVAQLRHAHITKVFDFTKDTGVYFMVLEYIPGETLAEKLAALNDSDTRLPLPEVIRILTTICDAVDYAHQARLIHRDIKPANILIDMLGEPILMDFGIAKMIGGSHHTSTGAAVGTAAYMSPQLVKGEPIDHRTDIYSLGIVLYEMISGRPPFAGDSTYEIMHSHVNAAVPSLDELDPGLPAALIAVVTKALAKSPNERYQTAAEMKNALRQINLAHPEDESVAARHLSRMATLFQAADVAYASGEYATCLGRLAELQRADNAYQPEQTAVLRQQALTGIQQNAEQDITNGRFDQAEIQVALLRDYAPQNDAIPRLINAIETGRQRRERLAHLDEIYNQSLLHLREGSYAEALRAWDDIVTAAGDIDYIDRLQVVRRAWDGISNDRYRQAQAALTAGQPQEALSLWQSIQADNPGFPDRNDLEGQMATYAVQQRRRRQAFAAVGSLLAILLITAVLLSLIRGDDPAGTTTATPNTAVAIAAATVTPTATTLPTATNTTAPTNTPLPTETVPPTPTSTATAIPTREAAAPFPNDLGTVTEPSSIYAAPNSAAAELALVQIDDPITILGRSRSGTWLFVRSVDGVTGFIFGERVLWDGDRRALPVRETAVTTSTTSTGPLELDMWSLPGTSICNASNDGWTQQIYMGARGGSGRYVYTWNNQPIGAATSGSVTYTIRSAGGSVIGTGTVTSTDGQAITRDLFIPRPTCNE